MSNRRILLVVDVQNGFVNPQSIHVVDPIAAFVEKWLDHGNRVIFTRFINGEDSQWESLMHWTRLRTSPETDLSPRLAEISALAPELAAVVEKRTYSSLTPGVMDAITNEDPSQVLVCGTATDACVLKTAVDLFEAGCTPLVVEDLCASDAGLATHRAGLMVIKRLIGAEQITTSAKIIG